MEDLKNKLTNIAGILGLVSGAILAVQTQGIVLPTWLLTVAGVCGALSVAILGYFTGKNADGSKKTPDQIVGQK